MCEWTLECHTGVWFWALFFVFHFKHNCEIRVWNTYLWIALMCGVVPSAYRFSLTYFSHLSTTAAIVSMNWWLSAAKTPSYICNFMFDCVYFDCQNFCRVNGRPSRFLFWGIYFHSLGTTAIMPTFVFNENGIISYRYYFSILLFSIFYHNFFSLLHCYSWDPLATVQLLQLQLHLK